MSTIKKATRPTRLQATAGRVKKTLPGSRATAKTTVPQRAPVVPQARKSIHRAAPKVKLPVASLPQRSKQARLIALLRSPEGGTIEQMVALTGWQSHTVRGTISGVLRKRLGLKVTSNVPTVGAPRIYRISSGVLA